MATDVTEAAQDALQNNIDRAIDHRREFYRYAITIATALLAFTVSFPPALNRINSGWLILLAWPALGIAIICGVIVHVFWAKFFISWRDYDNHNNPAEGQAVRKRITGRRRWCERVMLTALAAGVLGVAAFASLNFANVATKDVEARDQLRDQVGHGR